MHNLQAPKKIVPLLNRYIQPSSVLDVGCGIGTFLKVFKDFEAKRVLGLDGHWVDREQLLNHLKQDEFKEVDLSKPIQLDENFDLAISLEIVEHLPEKSADVIIETLVGASKVIVFATVVPFQGGQNHYTEPMDWLLKG